MTACTSRCTFAATLVALTCAGCIRTHWDEPRIVAVTPEPDAVEVPVDAVVEVRFDERIRASTLDAGNFYVWDVDGDVEVPGVRSYEIETRAARFVSDELYLPGRRYRVVVDDDVRSECCGVRLRNGLIWEFTTAPAAPATVDPGR